MRLFLASGQITPEGLRKALQTVVAIIYIVLQVLVFIERITKSPQE